MSEKSRKEADDLLIAAQRALQSAEATLGGVGMACFFTMKEQEEASQRAFAKRDAAKQLVELAIEFKAKHADFA